MTWKVGMKLTARKWLETILECEHHLLWQTRVHMPRLGEKVYCSRCEDMRKVIAVPTSWMANCRNCGFSCNRVSITAIHSQIHRHVMANDSHEIELYNYDLSEKYIVTAPSSVRMLQRDQELTLFEVE